MQSPEQTLAFAHELIQHKEISNLSNELGRNRIDHLFFKGTSLAHSLYPMPHLRPRMDSDILIRKEDRMKTHDLLLQLGYEQQPCSDEEVLSQQRAYIKATEFSHVVVDLHWHVTNRQIFKNAFYFDALFARSISLSKISPYAKGFGLSDALLISIIHPHLHHHGEQDPIWDEDNRIIIKAMTNTDWSNFLQATLDLKLQRTAYLALTRVDAHNHAPKAVIEKLATDALHPDALHSLSENSRNDFNQLLFDLRFAESMRQRLRILRATFFPNQDYLFEKYAVPTKDRSAIRLFRLYGQRIFAFLLRKLRTIV